MGNSLVEINKIKKELMLLRISKSIGNEVNQKDFKVKKKQIARLYTKMNQVNK